MKYRSLRSVHFPTLHSIPPNHDSFLTPTLPSLPFTQVFYSVLSHSYLSSSRCGKVRNLRICLNAFRNCLRLLAPG
ncbi:hypothetical protein RIF29_27191 [Crotalaria pallida]|uniref:Uncharacterized protein n=1 Tax=Crotalaria pallida TaxID=3830 RepID=A0AAN9EP55_CROPI